MGKAVGTGPSSTIKPTMIPVDTCGDAVGELRASVDELTCNGGDLVDTVQPIVQPREVVQTVVPAHHAPLLPGLEKPLRIGFASVSLRCPSV